MPDSGGARAVASSARFIHAGPRSCFEPLCDHRHNTGDPQLSFPGLARAGRRADRADTSPILLPLGVSCRVVPGRRRPAGSETGTTTAATAASGTLDCSGGAGRRVPGPPASPVAGPFGSFRWRLRPLESARKAGGGHLRGRIPGDRGAGPVLAGLVVQSHMSARSFPRPAVPTAQILPFMASRQDRQSARGGGKCTPAETDAPWRCGRSELGWGSKPGSADETAAFASTGRRG